MAGRRAARMHAAQRRKGTDVPDLSHLLGTCAIALEHGANEDQAIAALLHDAIEDVEPAKQARAVVATFGPEVLRIVLACSDGEAGNKGEWRQRKEAYIGRIATDDAPVLLVSASDKLHNARAIVAYLRVHGAGYLDRFTGGRDGTLWYYRALVDAFAANPPTIGRSSRSSRWWSMRCESLRPTPPRCRVPTRASSDDGGDQ